MLKLILGRAKSGKTTAIMEEISAHMSAGRRNIVLLVPEQFSYEAETELLRVCGDSLSLHAEVLSFTRLAARVAGEIGGARGTVLDKGGKLLCMALAAQSVASRLHIYGMAKSRPQVMDSVLSTIDELKSACIGPEQLLEAAQGRSDMLGDKMRDMALLYEAYDAVVAQGHADPSDRLKKLAEDIRNSKLAGGIFYLDGFTDFTRSEQNVIETLLNCGADVTVALTCEGLDETHEIFESSRKAAIALSRLAKSCAVQCTVVETKRQDTDAPMNVLERELFRFGEVHSDADNKVYITQADNISQECEWAAARCLSLVRDEGCRWRDIAIAVRGYDSYRAVLEGMFQRYGVPLYSAGKANIMEKPLAALLKDAYEIVTGRWSYEDVMSYAKTGLAGLSGDECLELEDYAFLWNINGSQWTREGDWRMHPEGYNGKYDEAVWDRLHGINALRRRLITPLVNFREAGRAAESAAGQAMAFGAFLEELNLAGTLEKRAAELDAMGMQREAAECKQLWDIIVDALEQCAAILGDMPMDMESFGKLFMLMLSKYEVGSIPLSLDKVSAGDMDRMRRRSIKHLLILGCDSARVPQVAKSGNVFSDDDRESLTECGIDIGGTADDRLSHEFALIYNCVTLPSDSVAMSYCCNGDEGAATPSFIVSRAQRIFYLEEKRVDIEDCRISAREPAFQTALCGRGEASMAANAYFENMGMGDELRRVREQAEFQRGQLGRDSVKALYGDNIRLAASGIDKFTSCKFSYFLQYGLRAKPRKAAAFAPPEMGTFMHYVLQHVAQAVEDRGGFRSVSDKELMELCDSFVQSYVETELSGFDGKNARFIYLFNRLTTSVRRIVDDMAQELRKSDFRPRDFELNFGDRQRFRPIELGEGSDKLVLTGIADRVDGWLHNGKLYIRVVDYKTGRKKFNLSDVLYGRNLQMLLYLFALEKRGEELYGEEIVPAGVMYVPARDDMVQDAAGMSDEDIAAARLKGRRRSGLVLGDEEVLSAMERGDSTSYIPVTLKNGKYSGDALASSENIGRLSRYVDELLRELAKSMHHGDIDADPYYVGRSDSACLRCDFAEACRFDSAKECRRYIVKYKAEEVWEKLSQEDSHGT